MNKEKYESPEIRIISMEPDESLMQEAGNTSVGVEDGEL